MVIFEEPDVYIHIYIHIFIFFEEPGFWAS